ncbi:MAG: EthD domain-containing protein [Rhodospirillaceae bacterium]|nr:EthD domain-containing protein [Rhodospirillaceae bacterium]
MTKATPTYKVFHFLRSKESVSLDEFKHVLSTAAASAKEDSASYFLTLAAGHQHENTYTPSTDPDYDALLEFECDSVAGAIEVERSLRNGALSTQLDPMIDQDSSPVVTSRILVMKDAPFAHIAQKMVCPINVRQGKTVEHFRDYWQNTHAKVAVDVLPVIHRYVQCHALASTYLDGRRPAFDGIAEFWFEDLAQAMSDAESDSDASVRNYEDQLNFMDTRDKLILIVEEAV